MNRYAISIPKPCHEDWAAMTPEEKGRFCAVCQKKVIDFTAMNPEQVDDFFDSNAGTKVCGRFSSDQLSEPVRIEIPRKALFMQTSFRNVFLLALAVSMGTMLFSCRHSTGEPALVGKVVVVDSAATEISPVETGLPGEPEPEDSVVLPTPPHATLGTTIVRDNPRPLKGDVIVTDTVAETVKGKVKVSE